MEMSEDHFYSKDNDDIQGKFLPWTGQRLLTSSMRSRDARMNLILPEGGVQTSALSLNCGFSAQTPIYLPSKGPPPAFVFSRSAASSV